MLSLSTFIFSSLLLAVNFEVSLGEEPAAGVEVNLLQIQNGKAAAIETKKTNSVGLIQFSSKLSPNASYAATANFDGLSFFSDLFSGAAVPQKPIELKIYRNSSDTSKLVIDEFSLFFRLEEGSLSIEESFSVFNPTTEVIVSELTEKKEEAEVFRFSVPQQAFNLRRGEGFESQNFRFESNSVIIQSPISPGKTFFSYSYEVDKPSLSLQLDHEFSLPIKTLKVGSNDPKLEFIGPRFETTGRKVYRDEWAEISTAALNSKVLSLKVKGLPLRLPVVWWLPALSMLLLTALGLYASRWDSRQTSKIDQRLKQKLLKDLFILEKMKEQSLLSISEYRIKKLKILEQLAPYYESV